MDGLLEAGRAALQAGNVFAAIRSAKQVLQDNPQDTDAMDLLCSAHMAERDYMSAQQVIDSWLRIDPLDPDAHTRQIYLQMSLGRQDDAKARIEQFALSFPNQVHLSMWMEAMWEEAFGAPGKAASLYEEMLSHFPDDASLKMRLAMAEAEGRNFILARKLSMEVLAQDQVNPDALRTAAIGAFKVFNLSDARQLARAARAANPLDMAMKKTIWLSWLVLLPPFALGHVMQMIMSVVRFSVGNIAANVFGGLIAIETVGLAIFASEANRSFEPLSLPLSIMLATLFLAGCWALSVYYIFGVGNADEDKRTASMTGGY